MDKIDLISSYGDFYNRYFIHFQIITFKKFKLMFFPMGQIALKAGGEITCTRYKFSRDIKIKVKSFHNIVLYLLIVLITLKISWFFVNF